MMMARPVLFRSTPAKRSRRAAAPPAVGGLLLTVSAALLWGCDGDPLPPDNPVPAITELTPAASAAGVDGLELTVVGADFVPGAEVLFAGEVRTTTVESVSRLRAAGGHTCGLDVSGAAYCWGPGFHGQLGTGRTGSSSVPIAVSPYP